MTTHQELESRIKADVSARIPLEGLAIEATSSYLRSVKISETSLVQIIEEIIEDDPVRANAYDLKLTGEASELLGKDIKAFMDKHGEYFVYGHVSRARFTAVCTIKTSSKELRQEIKNALTVKAGDANAISGILESYNSSKKDGCSIDTDLEVDRLSGKDPEKKPHFRIGEIVKAWDHFQDDFQTVPYMALLCHYSVLDPRFPLPQHQFRFLGSQMSSAYQTLYLAQSELSNSRMVQAASCSANVGKACDKIRSLDVNDENAVASMHETVQACVDEVEHWRLRFDLQDDAKKLEDHRIKYVLPLDSCCPMISIC